MRYKVKKTNLNKLKKYISCKDESKSQKEARRFFQEIYKKV